MAAYYHIEGNYYLVPDEFSWNIGHPKRVNKKTGLYDFSFDSYHSTIEDALIYYLKIKQRLSATRGEPGTIRDLMDKLTAETKTFTETVKNMTAPLTPEIPEVLKDLRP